MKKKLRFLFILFFIFGKLFFICGQTNPDSLLILLKTATADTQKVTILYELCINQNEPEAARKYADQIIAISEKSDYKKGLTWGYNLTGSILKQEGNFNEALKYHFKALEILTAENDSLGIAKVNNNIGESYRLLGDPTKALSYYLKSLGTLEKLKKPRLIALSMNNIAIIYRQQKNPDKALEYDFKSIAIRKEIGDVKGVADSYDNIGIIYFEQKKYAQAIESSLKALEIREQEKDTIGLASNYNNVSSIYSQSGDQIKGLSYQLKSLAMREFLKDKRGIAMSYNNLGNIYNLKGDYKAAMAYQLKAIALAKKVGSREILRGAYESMVILNKNLKDYEKAFEYQNLFTLIKDSMLNTENSKQIAEMQTKYDTEKKDQENQLLSKDNQVKEVLIKNQDTERSLLIFSIIAIIFFSLLLYSRYKLKQKELFQKELIKQKELRSKAIIEAEEKERIRIAQELHDGIGQQLSAVKLNMSSLEANLELKNPEQKLMMKNALDIIDDSVKEVRSVSHSMMPNALIKSGLTIAVREFLNRISNTDKLKIKLEIDGLNDRLESVTEIVIFRVLQETVNNIIKHSQATIVNIQIIRYEDELTLIVEDNGIGFEISKLTNNSIGIKNIQSRIEYLNGTVHFDSHPGKGTTVSIEIPIK